MVGAGTRRWREERSLSTIAERLAAAGTGNAIELRGVSRLFGALAALSDITLSVRPGERRAELPVTSRLLVRV